MARKVDGKPSLALSNEFAEDSDSDEGPARVATLVSKNYKSTPKKLSMRTSEGGKSPTSDKQEDEEDEITEDEATVALNGGDDTSSTDGSSASEGSRKRAAPREIERAKRPAKKPRVIPQSTTRIAPRPFKAPESYDAVKVSALRHDLKLPASGKAKGDVQIWHITAPASVKLRDLKSLDLGALSKGTEVLTQRGISYTMHQERSQRPMILLPDSTDGVYKSISTPVAHSFFVRETTSIPPSKAGSGPHTMKTDDTTVFTAVEEGVKRKPREQPTGLKMRYIPYGVATQTTEDVEMVDADVEDQHDVPEPENTQMDSPAKDKAEGVKTRKKKRISQEAAGEISSSPIKVDASPKKKKKKRST